MFPPKKHAKIVTVPLNGWGILQICLRSLEYILRFQTKLVFKLSFGNFRIFLRLCSLFTIFAPQKTPKNYHWSLKEMRCPPKLLVLLKIHVRGFKKIVTGPLNGCGSCPLEYVLKFTTGLLVKLCFGSFRIFLKLYSLFNIFVSQKPPESHHRPLKEM